MKRPLARTIPLAAIAALALLGASCLPALPARWPSANLELGMSDAPGGAASMRATAPFAFRSQYLAGGVNTGHGWSTWNTDGAFVTYYVQDSAANHITPVFDYYQLLQSAPGDSRGEADANLANLNNRATMAAYYDDLRLFFQRAGAFPNTTVILHVEPDLWGYIEQRARNDDARTVPASVASSGVPELAGLPDDATGFAQAVIRLRDRYAPNVLVAYHMSIWGTMHDTLYEKTADVDALATRAAAFYASLGARFDIAFTDGPDRDAAFRQIVLGDPNAWYGPDDYARHVRFLSTFVAKSHPRLVLWQIPLGNTKMRAMDNTWGHYQDNHVEWLLDDASRAHLDAYRKAGVVAFIFGGGADGTTCACDARHDGVTNPAPFNNNTATSLNADDDGGFFKQKAAAYYAAGPIPLAAP